MSLVVASLVRNEMGRFWRTALRTWATFADEIVVVDDGSTDGTREFAEDFGAHVYALGGTPKIWGAEAPARQHLFEVAWGHARIGDYVLWLDADMTPAKDPGVLMDANADGIFFNLYDLWTPSEYRSDEFWRGHLGYRLWMVRKRDGFSDWKWSTRGVHCGHLPENFRPETFVFAPPDFGLLHYAYVALELREEKYVSYAKVADQLSEAELLHARSILDPDPHLQTLVFKPDLSFV